MGQIETVSISVEGAGTNLLANYTSKVSNQVHEAANTNYDVSLLQKLEQEAKNYYSELRLPAIKNDRIPQVFGVIEQIVGGKSLGEVHTFLESTGENTARARADLQRCGALLQKIAAIHDESGINWNRIFSRLEIQETAA